MVAIPDKFKAAAKAGIDSLAEGIVALPDKIGEAADTLKSAVTGWDADQLKGTTDYIVGKTSEAVSNLADKVDQTAGDVQHAVGEAYDKTTDKIADVINDPAAAAKGAVDAASDAYKSGVESVRKALKDFERSDPEAVRQTLADGTFKVVVLIPEVATQEAAVAALGKGAALVRGGESVVEAVEGGEAVRTGRGWTETEAPKVRTAAPEQDPPTRVGGMNEAPAKEIPRSATPREGHLTYEDDVPYHEDPNIDAAGKPIPEDLSEGAPLGRGHHNPLDEASAKLDAAEKQLPDLGKTPERVPGGRDAEVQRLHQQYEDGLEKARQGLGDQAYRDHMDRDVLKRLDDAVKPENAKSLEDFRRSAGMEPKPSAMAENAPVPREAPTVHNPPIGVAGTKQGVSIIMPEWACLC